MTLEQLINLYLAGALVTGLGTRNLKSFHRRSLLWPIYWLYVGALVLIEIKGAINER